MVFNLLHHRMVDPFFASSETKSNFSIASIIFMPSPFSRYGAMILSIRTASISTSASWSVCANRSGLGWISSDVSLINIPIIVSLHIPVRSALRPQTIPPPARFLRLTIPFSLPCRRWGRARYFFPVFSPLCIFLYVVVWAHYKPLLLLCCG